MSPIIDQVVKQLEMLPDELQWRVLEFTRAISGSLPRGTPANSCCISRARSC